MAKVMTTRRDIITSGLGLAGIIAAGRAPAAFVRSMVAARAAAMGGGQKGWENPYVTDGLIAMWDGQWNAGGGIHDSSLTKYVDLSGNGNDLTALNNPCIVTDYYMGFDGTDRRMVRMFPKATSMTIEFLASASVQRGCILSTRHSLESGNAYLDNVCHRTQYNSGSIANYDSRGIQGAEVGSYEATYILEAVDGNTRLRTYFNGRPIPISAWQDITISGISKIWAGITLGSWNGIWCLTGMIYTVRIYMRALSAQEIAYNHQANTTRDWWSEFYAQ